jgi:SAM-dependent methyltransferase
LWPADYTWEDILKILDLGCGQNKYPGSIGVDWISNPGVDVLCDLNALALPFPEGIFDAVRLIHVVEHLQSIPSIMEEVYRVSKAGAEVIIVTPHYTDASSWQDPTHRWHLNSYSFNVFEERADFSYYSNARFRVAKVEIRLLKLYRLIGLEFVVNLSERLPQFRSLRRFWEQYLCFLVRGKYMTFHLQVLK